MLHICVSIKSKQLHVVVYYRNIINIKSYGIFRSMVQREHESRAHNISFPQTENKHKRSF